MEPRVVGCRGTVWARDSRPCRSTSDSVVSSIEGLLLDGRFKLSVLSDGEIRDLVARSASGGTPLIDPFDPHAVEGASYDMSLGSLMVVGGKPRHVAEGRESHTLEPGDFVVLTTRERLQLPVNIVGHNGIMSPWARAGLVSLFSPQIDPGFVGVLEVPVFNAGDDSIVLIPGHRIFTVEFVHMSKAASFSWVERHGPKNPPSEPLPPSTVRANLRDIAELRDRQAKVVSLLKNLKLEVAADRANSDKRLTVIDTRLASFADLDQRRTARAGVKWSRRQTFWGIVGVAVAVATFALGWWAGAGDETPRQPASTTSVPSTTAAP